LSSADPADAAAFKANSEKYTKTLDELNAYAHAKFDKVADDSAFSMLATQTLTLTGLFQT
ncbi:hypothetical protein ACC724_37765, partial [Rhizobium ruizarguesonis]